MIIWEFMIQHFLVSENSLYLENKALKDKVAVDCPQQHILMLGGCDNNQRQFSDERRIIGLQILREFLRNLCDTSVNVVSEFIPDAQISLIRIRLRRQYEIEQ